MMETAKFLKPVAPEETSRRLQRLRKQFSIIQISAMEALVSALDSECAHVLTFTSEIKGVDAWYPNVLVWRCGDAEIHHFKTDGMKQTSSFAIAEGSTLALHQNSIFQICDTGLRILSLKGEAIDTLFVEESLGKACHMDVCEEYLITATTKWFVCVWKISGTEIKPYGSLSGRRVQLDSEVAGDIFSLRCNCDGTKISFLTNGFCVLDQQHRLYIYDTVLAKLLHYSFSANQKPFEHGWDGEEPKLIACETCLVANNESAEQTTSGREAITLFVDSASGVYKQDKVNIDNDTLGLLGIHVPYRYFVQNSRQDLQPRDIIRKQTLNDFVGTESMDEKTRENLLNYSYNVSIGNIYAAYSILDSIQNAEIWENIARSCVKSRRLDVALYCFGKMKLASAIAFVRLSLDEPEEEARVAALAIELGLEDEAQALYIECRRYDLLNQMHQMCGDWEKALQVASKHDRIHLKNTHYAYAKHLETLGNIEAAKHHYELSETHRYEVPRMLHSVQQIDELQDYVDKSHDPVLLRWWAHFCEANNHTENAIVYYKAAGDIKSLVRLYCLQENFSAASNVVTETSNASAAFYLARQYEKIGNIPSAIQSFTKAGKYSYAAELAMKYGVDSELLSLSLQSPKELMLSSAEYFEAKAMYEESVLLYHKGGDLEKAIDVCFRSKLFDALKAIADDLDEGSDPALLARCGGFLMEHNQLEKAVQLFIAAKHYDHALDLCIKDGVTITEKMADLFTPNKDDKKTDESKRLLARIAENCKLQGSYHLACKKYTQAGDRTKAMQALLKSGDTERIIFFANVSRQKQIYVLAANYLQSLDWRNDATIMKNIVQMYTKASEMLLLASFYESCAQIEIDEFRDYGKALGAMKEAVKHLLKSNSPNRDEALKSLQSRTSEVERFVQVRRLAKTDPMGMLKGCSDLLLQLSKSPNNAEAAVRIGDIYALLIEFHHSEGNMEQALEMVDKMKSRRIALGPYVDPLILGAVYKANGLQAKSEVEGYIEEDIVED